MKHLDCFALAESKSCIATSRTDCDGCSFYKTHEEYKRDQRKSQISLNIKGLQPEIKTVCGYYESGGRYEKQIMSTEKRTDI